MAKATRTAAAKAVPPPAPAPAATPAAVARWALGVALLVAVLWSPAMRNGFCADDVYLIVEADVEGPGALSQALSGGLWNLQAGGWKPDYFRPLANASYVLGAALHGRGPAGFHAANIALHAAVAGLLVVWLVSIGVALPIAAAGALLFGVHPALAEAVAWIAGRTDPLAACFALVYLVLDARTERRGARIAAPFALAAALLSKESALAAPVAAIAADLARGVRVAPALRRRTADAFVIALWFAVRAVLLGTPLTHGQAAIGGVDVYTRLAAVPHLAGLLPLPWLGRVDYGAGLSGGVLALAAAAGVALIAGLVVAARRATRGGGPAAVLALGALGALVPLAAAAVIKATIAQRLVYLPALFVMPLAALVAHRVLPQPRAAFAALALVGVAFAATAVARIPLWASTTSLWTAAAREPNASPLARSNAAKGLHDDGRLDEALEILDGALPSSPNAVGFQLRAVIHTELGCYDLALPDFRRALELNPGDDRVASNLATLLGEMGRPGEAADVLDAFVARFSGPGHLAARIPALRAAAAAGTAPVDDAALRCGDAASARARARDPAALVRRAALRLRDGILNQADVLLRAALARDPRHVPALVHRAWWLAASGDPAAARAQLREVLAREPGHTMARRLDEAIAKGTFGSSSAPR